MSYWITKEVARQARANGWKLTVGLSDQLDSKGRNKQNGTLIAEHVSGFEFSGSNEVFIDCFFNNAQSEQEFWEKYS